MQVFESITAAHLKGPTHLTIGSFDGMHRGHSALIAAMQEAARADGAACGLLTFHPHPRAVLFPDKPIVSISSLAQRLKLYAQAGLDFTIVHPFTLRTAQTESEDFMDLLKEHLALTDLWVGPDFALGHNRGGNVSFLQAYGQKIGVQVHISPEFRWENVPVRSSRIRDAIARGNIEWADVWLGRYFTLSGVIVYGEQRGRTLGFPTANLSVSQNRAHPADGVYAAWAEVEGRRYPAVVNIGVRPTVNGAHRTIEAHIIDFDEDIYGRCLALSFVARLRDEIKFPSLDALKAQIARDRDLATWMLAADPQLPDYQRYRVSGDEVIIAGATPEDLFAHAAIALFGLQAAYDVQGPTIQQYVEAQGGNRAALLGNWLRALRQQEQDQGLMAQNIIVRKLDETSIGALAFGRIDANARASSETIPLRALVLTPPQAPVDLWRARLSFES